MNNSLWIEKYKPQKLGDIICNKGPTEKINNWVNNWHKTREKILSERKNNQKNKKRKWQFLKTQ